MLEPSVKKYCSKCKQTKALSEFHKRRDSKDGLQCHCNVCHKTRKGKTEYKSAQHRYYNKNKAHIIETQKQYNQTEQGKITKHRYRISDKGKVAQKRGVQSDAYEVARIRYRQRHPERFVARAAANHAVRTGRLPKPSTLFCRDCGEPAQQYHHFLGYAPEYQLDVVAVCRDCHIAIHHNEPS